VPPEWDTVAGAEQPTLAIRKHHLVVGEVVQEPLPVGMVERVFSHEPWPAGGQQRLEGRLQVRAIRERTHLGRHVDPSVLDFTSSNKSMQRLPANPPIMQA